MPATYTLIASNTLSSTASFVTFSSIPATYTDLVFRISSRNDTAATYGDIAFRFQNDQGAFYGSTIMRGNGSAASGVRYFSVDSVVADWSQAANNATASTFGSTEIYIPSYLSSMNKVSSVFGAGENNATSAGIAATAGLYTKTTAITRIDILGGGGSFVSGSSFFLYGIKNS